MGVATRCRRAVDAALLEVERWRLRAACRLLGSARRFLWRHQLRLRLWRGRLRGWLLGARRLQLQSDRQQFRQYWCDDRLQQDGHQQYVGDECKLQRWDRRYNGAADRRARGGGP